jgi:hypothetical protein
MQNSKLILLKKWLKKCEDGISEANLPIIQGE